MTRSGSYSLHRTVGIAEIHRDHRHARRARRGDVGLGIADHQRARHLVAARRLDGAQQRQRVGLGDAKSVLAADEGETIGDAELFQQQPRRPLDLVGADREKIAPRRKRVKRRDHAGIEAAVVGDAAFVIDQKKLEHFFELARPKRWPAAPPVARWISARAPAPSSERASSIGVTSKPSWIIT